MRSHVCAACSNAALRCDAVGPNVLFEEVETPGLLDAARLERSVELFASGKDDVSSVEAVPDVEVLRASSACAAATALPALVSDCRPIPAPITELRVLQFRQCCCRSRDGARSMSLRVGSRSQ